MGHWGSSRTTEYSVRTVKRNTMTCVLPKFNVTCEKIDSRPHRCLTILGVHPRGPRHDRDDAALVIRWQVDSFCDLFFPMVIK